MHKNCVDLEDLFTNQSFIADCAKSNFDSDGYTALSASGFVVDQTKRLILTAGSLIAPFRKFKSVGVRFVTI